MYFAIKKRKRKKRYLRSLKYPYVKGENISLTILTSSQLPRPFLGPSEGGLGRGLGEAQFVSDFRVVFFGCRCRYG